MLHQNLRGVGNQARIFPKVPQMRSKTEKPVSPKREPCPKRNHMPGINQPTTSGESPARSPWSPRSLPQPTGHITGGALTPLLPLMAAPLGISSSPSSEEHRITTFQTPPSPTLHIQRSFPPILEEVQRVWDFFFFLSPQASGGPDMGKIGANLVCDFWTLG